MESHPGRLTLGIDIGGTTVKIGLCDDSHSIVDKTKIDTDPKSGAASLAARTLDATRKLLHSRRIDESQLRAIGVGAPGPLDPVSGVVLEAPNLETWKNVPLRDIFRSRFNRPVCVENDANAAAYGEFVAGAAREYSSAVMLTLGTGLGAGVVLNNQLLRGDHGAAAEIGHMIAVPNGRQCNCGQRGCLERYVSATAIVDRLIESARSFNRPSPLAHSVSGGYRPTAEEIAQLATSDPLARQTWDETCDYLAIGCINLMRLFDVSCILLGGGVANAGDALLGPVRERYAAHDWHMSPARPEIRIAALGENAGMVGCAALARVAAV